MLQDEGVNEQPLIHEQEALLWDSRPIRVAQSI